ncbi:hypothetical protein ACQ4PT_040812 [Festuca glaucescens]
MQVQLHGWPLLRPVRVGRLPPQLKFCASAQRHRRVAQRERHAREAAHVQLRVRVRQGRLLRRPRQLLTEQDLEAAAESGARCGHPAAEEPVGVRGADGGSAQFSSPPSRRDDTLLEKQDGIASSRTARSPSTVDMYEFWNWFDDRTWYPLGRVIGGTVNPGLTLTAGSIWCGDRMCVHSSNFLSIRFLGYLPIVTKKNPG